MTIEEKHLIDRFHAGHFDGMVGNMFETTGGSLVWTEIKEGKITRYKQGPGGRFFNGRENEHYSGVLHIIAEFSTTPEIFRSFRNLVGLCKIKRPTSIVPNSNKNA